MKSQVSPGVMGWALLSDDERMRYRLARSLNGKPLEVWRGQLLRPASVRTIVFVMLNPSTADALADDPTIRRCVGFARAAGADVLEVVNLFALRSTSPDALYTKGATAGDLGSGPDNDEHILAACRGERVVAAWGAPRKPGRVHDRGARVRELLEQHAGHLAYLRLTRHGHPEHPLYLPKILTPTEWCR